MKTKTTLQLFALIVPLILVANTQAQSVTVPTVTVSQGASGNVALSLVAGGGATNFDFTMTYDPAVVNEATMSVNCNPAVVGLTSLTCAIDKTKNQIKGIGINLAQTALSSGGFATVTLPVLADAAIGSSVKPINEHFATASTVTPVNATWTLNVDIVAPNVDNEFRNMSTRAEVRTGNEILIGGFVIVGSEPKCVVIQGLGGSVAVPAGVTRLADPTLEIKQGLTTVAQNDNWQDQAPADVQAIEDSGRAPNDILEAAVYKCLNPGAYTALVRGFQQSTGVGTVAIYDADDSSPYLKNISTRSWVGTQHAISIAGFVITGNTPKKVLVVGLGPSMASAFPPNSPLLFDPTLWLYKGATQIATNDDWGDAANAAEIGALPAPLPPTNAKEPAILMVLEPGLYTAQLRGVGGTVGIGNVAVYDLTGR